jgi:quercetin dioxygenase-like cupin family protein
MTHVPAPDGAPLPPDDLSRNLVVGRAEDDALPHIGLAGDSYTILVSGEDTGGQFTLIDMLVPPGGGPPPHRHDFEETFTVLEGAIEVTFRGETVTLSAGQTANIPANAPHRFTNAGDATAHLLCTCSPAGQDAFFLQVGDRLPSRDAHAPKPTDEALSARGAKVGELAALYRTEMLT